MSYHLCVYLIKEIEYDSYCDLFKEEAVVDYIEVEHGSLNNTMIFKGHNDPHDPIWLQFLRQTGANEFLNGITNNSSRAVLVTEVNNRIMCLTFGHGRHMLKDELFVRDFGIRAVDKTKFENNPMSSRTQASVLTNISNFEAKDYGNFLMGVIGESRIEQFGKTITGRDSFSFLFKYQINDLKHILELILSKYEATDYLVNFDFFDRMRIVKDIEVKNELDDRLIAQINSREFQNINLTPPEIIEWGRISKFKYSNSAEPTSNLSIGELIETSRITEYSTRNIKTKKILAIDSDGQVFDSWSLYNCIVTELELNDKTYTLTSGIWFEIDNDFVEFVNSYINEIPNSNRTLPVCPSDYTEGQYNDFVGNNNYDIITMDRKFSTIDNNRIEFCDLLTQEREIIHVKPWKSSSTLSHLFSQGVISSRIMLEEEPFRIQVKEHIVNLSEEFQEVIEVEDYSSDNYEIIYAVIYSGNKSMSERLPFFSKLNMMINTKTLKNMGYLVSKCHIVRESN